MTAEETNTRLTTVETTPKPTDRQIAVEQRIALDQTLSCWDTDRS
jgi:hypothetical protein